MGRLNGKPVDLKMKFIKFPTKWRYDCISKITTTRDMKGVEGARICPIPSSCSCKGIGLVIQMKL